MVISNGLDKKIEKIINDLYMIDGSFKKNEKEVVRIVEELLRARPDAEVDEKFIEKLHLALARRMELIKEEKETRARAFGAGIFSKLVYSFAGAAAMLLITVVGVSYYFNQAKNPIDRIAINSALEIEKLKDGAFGSLAFDQSKNASKLSTGGGAPLGLGGVVPLGLGGGSPASADQKRSVGMPSPDIINYRFVYKGGDIPIENKATVYKRTKNFSTGGGIMEILSSLNFGLIDFSKFSNVRMNSLSFTEDRSYGYDVSIDFQEGAASIYAGIGWPDPYAGCSDEACYESRRLRDSDMLKDEEAIAIADKFLSDYRIDKSAYGEPAAIKDYMAYYKGPAVQNSAMYVPETISIVYPIKIGNQVAYDDVASLTGMTVEVGIRQKKVFGARNIYAQKYESSDYEAEQDKNKIISLAENGGTFGNYRSPEAAQTIDIELGTPEIKLVAAWNYDSEKRTTESLFVPYYVFPVIKAADEGYYYQRNIIVPVPKEMFDKILQPDSATPGLLKAF